MTLPELRERRTKIQSWLHGPADRFGECDDCPADHVSLWDDVDTEGAGDFSSCRDCWRKRLERILNALRTFNAITR